MLAKTVGRCTRPCQSARFVSDLAPSGTNQSRVCETILNPWQEVETRENGIFTIMMISWECPRGGVGISCTKWACIQTFSTRKVSYLHGD